ncbi:hypothetical protein NRB16_12565 [Pseudomonas sp. LJDD11]|nr:hypothetical protein [Pseudomonas sp. LJDD11]MCQ9424347.1 hypothetical protein [Pseudomonas sp. LJDD11]
MATAGAGEQGAAAGLVSQLEQAVLAPRQAEAGQGGGVDLLLGQVWRL